MRRVTKSVLANLIVCAGLLTLAGCRWWTNPIVPGTYSGDVDCLISAPDGAGGEVSEPFTESLVVEVDSSGDLTINGVAVELGSLHVRSIPTADLSLEVVDIVKSPGRVEVTYEPRPTLVGIEMDGELVEVYESDPAGLAASAEADFIITDIDGPHPLSIECSGILTP